MKQAHTSTSNNTSLINPVTIEGAVETAHTAERLMYDANQLVIQARELMESVFGASCVAFKISKDEEVKNEIKQATWGYLLNAIDFWKTASVKQTDEYRNKISYPAELPDVTIEGISHALEALHQNRKVYALESISEVYNFLRTTDPSREKLKTKQRTYVGDKVVLVRTYTVYDKRYASLHLESYARNRLIAMDKVFHYLDANKPFTANYNSPLIDAMESSLANRAKQPYRSYAEGMTDYFVFKVYMNGNVHITFRRKDLVARLNQIAGKAELNKENE